jgi:hypothetical protein
MSESGFQPKPILLRPVGYVRSPYTQKAQIPKGPGAKHEAEGILEILPEFERGLLDIEGFSHLYVMWVFDRAEPGDTLVSTPPTDDRSHGVFASRSPQRRTLWVSALSSCWGENGIACACVASTCSMARHSSTSNLICRACRRTSCGAAGWRRRKDAGPAIEQPGNKPETFIAT